MATVLAKLRDDLDVLPSPVPGRPGLLLRDPLRYSDAAVVLPPLLARCLPCFDGAHTDVDLHGALARLTGRDDLARAGDDLARGLSDSGFLEDQAFLALRDRCHRAFAAAPVREAAFAGGGYPDERDALSSTLQMWRAAPPAPDSASPQAGLRSVRAGAVLGIAAPHVSPAGGVASYGAAYRALDPQHTDGTFVILGTSHYGRVNRFGVTRKDFRTPLGQATTDTALVDRLIGAAPDALDVEDYCHSVEHSIEFQVVFLQSLFGPAVRILPILCGPLAGGPTPARRLPEDDRGVARVLAALGDLQAARGAKLRWILGIDMAHMGRRYGDAVDARAHEGLMREVSARDQARLDRVTAGDAAGFWDLLRQGGHDDLKWCGTAPLYTFLRAHPGVRGQVLHYDQWNIDAHSVVSFAALSFEG